MQQFECKVCGRRYSSDVRLSEPPTCSKNPATGHSHKQTPMTQTEGEPTMAAEAKATKAKTAKTPDKECQCFTEPVPGKAHTYQSCGRMTRSEFAPGHDAKLKSALIAAAVDGSKITRNGKTEDPKAVAKTRGWERFIDRAVEVAAEKQAKAEARAAAREQAKAEKAAAKKAPAKAPAKAKTSRTRKAPAKKAAVKS